jgi:hypothetical protein
MILLGCGIGLAVVPLTLTAIAKVQPMEAGIASALVSVSQQVGGSIGLAVLGTVAVHTTRGRIAHLGAHPGAAQLADASTAGYQNAFLVAAGVFVAAFLLALAAIRPAKQPVAPRQAAPST